MSETRKLAAILAADVVAYSGLMGEDEAGTARAVREHREAAGPMVADTAAGSLRRRAMGFCWSFPPSSLPPNGDRDPETDGRTHHRQAGGGIVYRIGVNLGDVLIEGDDILGDGVNIAARLERICEY
jgi:class 3 adenylate cyclase